MKRPFRLTRSVDFKRVRLSGKSYTHPLLVLVTLPSEGQGVRVGIAAGKSVGGAVQRNRAKRLLRAACSALIKQITPGWDFLLIARRPLSTAKLSDVIEALPVLLQRAGLLKANVCE